MVEVVDLAYDNTLKRFVTNTPILKEWIGMSYSQVTQQIGIHDMWFYHEVLDTRHNDIEAFITSRAKPIFPSTIVLKETGINGGRGENNDSVSRTTPEGAHVVGTKEWFDAIREELKAPVEEFMIQKGVAWHQIKHF